MPQSLSQVIVHFVFSTQNREPFIDYEISARLHGYIATLSTDLNCHAYRIGGVEDHVHAAVLLHRTVPQSDWVEHVKSSSSKWIKKQGNCYSEFLWQRGYGAFSISPKHLDALISYIGDQKEHHSRESFQDEYLRLLAKYGVSYDERYVWD